VKPDTAPQRKSFVVCLQGGGVVNLSGEASLNSSSYVWSSVPATGISWQTRKDTITPKIQFINEGNYTLKLTTDNSCNRPSTDTLHFKVISAQSLSLTPQPDACAVIDVYKPKPIIAGAKYTFDGNIFNPNTGIKADVGQHIVIAVLENECGNQEIRDTFTIVQPVPVQITTERGKTLCVNGSLTLTASVEGGRWQGTDINANTGVFTPKSEGRFTLTYLRGTSECERKDTINIVVVKAVSLTLTPQSDECSVFNYLPKPVIPNAVYTLDGTAFNPNTGVQAGLGSHTVLVTLENACGKQEAKDTFVVAQAETLKISTTRGQSLCTGKTVTLDVSPANGTWTGTSVTSKGVFTPQTAGNFVLTYSIGSGSCLQKDTISFNVVAGVALILTPQSDECTVFNYLPKPVIPNAIYTLDGAIFNPNTGIQAGFGEHKVLVSLENACGKQEVKDTFSVTQSEALKINTARGQSVCLNKSLNLDVTPTGGTWSGQFVTASGVFNPQTVGNYVLTYSRGSGSCLQKDTIAFNVVGTVSLSLNNQADQCLAFKYRPTPLVPNAVYTMDGVVFNANDGVDVGVGSHIIEASLKNLCDSSKITKTFKITGLPAIDLMIGDTVACYQGGTLTLKASASTNDGRWSGAGVENGVFTPSKAGFGIQTLTYTAGGTGCEANKTIKVKVIGVEVKTGMNDLKICDPARAVDVPLIGGSPAGGQYRLETPTGQILTKITPSVLGVGTHKIYYVLIDSTTSSLACPSYAFFTVIIYGRPAGGIQGDSAKCTNTPLSIKASGGDSYAWDLGEGTTKQGATISHSYSKEGVYNVRLIVVSDAGCRDTLFKSVKIDAPADAVPSPKDTIICSGSAVQYRIVSGKAESFTWLREGEEVAKGKQPPPLVFENFEQNNKTYQMSLTMGVSVCPNQSQTMKVSVRPKVKAVISASKNRVCSNESVQFAPNLSRGHITRWQWDLGNGVISRDSLPSKMVYQADTIVRFIPIRLIVEDSLCGKDTSTFQLEVIPLSTKAFLNVEQIRVCQGIPTRFVNQSSRFSNIVWNFGDGSTFSSDSIAFHIFKKTGTFTVTLEAYNICGGYAKDTQRITVLPSPQLDSVTYKRLDKCNETRVQFKGYIQNTQPTVYKWTFSNGDTSLLEQPILDFKTGGIFKAILNAIFASNGCPARDSVSLVLKNPLALKIDSLVPDICGNNNGVVMVSVTGGNQPYRYAVNDTNFQFDRALFRNLRGRETYNIFVKDAVGCTQATKTYLDGRPPLVVSLGPDLKIDLGDSVLIRAETNFKSTKNTFKWLNTEGVRCGDCVVSAVRPKRTQAYRVLAKDSLNCEALDTILVEVVVKRLIAMPNVFSPDDSGHNDKLFPSGGVGVEKVNYLRVYDQNGILVYEKLNFQPNEASVGWDGVFKNQALVPQTVTYVMEVLFYDDEKKVYKGNVLLIK
jgi:large repetitive protein